MSEFDRFNDDQLAKHISAGAAELRARQKRQREELAERHNRQLREAASLPTDENKKKPGRKPKEKADAIAA